VIDGRAAIAILGPDGPGTAPALVEAARAMGRLLCEAGYSLVVAGAQGVARGACAGAAEAKGTVLALTPKGSAVEATATTVTVEASPLGRIQGVLDAADALVLLPGDLVSLAILLQVWSYGTTPDAPYRQMLLVGEHWPGTVKALADAAGLDQKARAMVTFVNGASEVVDVLRYYVAPGAPAPAEGTKASADND
jgi:predicted Rossmann-fold nucleotide-binding protein